MPKLKLFQAIDWNKVEELEETVDDWIAAQKGGIAVESVRTIAVDRDHFIVELIYEGHADPNVF